MRYLLRCYLISSSSSITPGYKNPFRFSLQTLISAMAGSGEDFPSFSTTDVAPVQPTVDPATDLQMNGDSPEALDLEFGFKRPEMYKEKFPGTVNPYDRHVFLCFKTAESWPARVEDASFDPLPKKLGDALQSRKSDIQGKTRFTVIEGTDDNEFKDGDVLIFPEMIKYKNLNHEDVDNFVEDVLVKGTTWALGTPEVLKGYHVFVCCHTSRDKRCGVCGPALLEKLNKEIELQGKKDQIFVTPCSHVGGHKYAGNLIIFGANPKGIVMGHWYGYVTPDDVPLLLDQHIGKGQIVEKLWRGEVCNFQEEKKEIDEVQENGNVNDLEETNLDKSVKEAEGSSSIGTMENGGSCCQGSNGFSCCSMKKSVAEKMPTKSGTMENGGQGADEFSCCSLDKSVADHKPKESSSASGKGCGRISAWLSKWEQEDVFAAAAVVGAVASIAVAFGVYRRSG